MPEPATPHAGLTARDLPPLPDDLHASIDGARLDPRAWFPTPDAPFELEIGSGKGTFLVQHAEQHPGVNILGIEWAGEFFRHAADRVERRKLPNVRVLYADACEFLRYRVPAGITRVIHLYFSDPWPKSRHHKNRVVQDRFLADAWRALSPEGELRIVTDHSDYWSWMEEHFARWTTGPAPTPDALPLGILPPLPCAAFERLPFAPADSAGDAELVGSNFERKYRREGRPFHAATLRKRQIAP